MMGTRTIEMREVSFNHPTGKGVQRISITLDGGECLGLLGRNGSGKTTLTLLLLGLHRPKTGTVRVFGHAVSRGSRAHLARTGVALDDTPLWENLSGYGNAFFAARSYGLSRRRIARDLEALFESAGMADQAHAPVSTYSYGMKKKVGLIRALVHGPDLLVLDEPTAGVDPYFMGFLTESIRRRTENGKTTWLASNDADWLAGVDPRILILDRGCVVDDGSVRSFLDQVSALEEIRIILDGYASLSPPQIPQICSFHQEGNVVVIVTPPHPSALPEVVRWIVSLGVGIRSIRCSGAGLKEAFMLRTGRPVNG
jgi:ABC-2 type transport system ATP-binding protein